MKVYEQTMDGVRSEISIQQGLDLINFYQMDGSRFVKSMSQISRGSYAILKTDGTHIRLVQVEKPELSQGEAVRVQRPGRTPITGVVAHIQTAPGYVAVLDDKYRSVTTYPVQFVARVPAEWTGSNSRPWHLHRFPESNQARCNSRIRPIVQPHNDTHEWGVWKMTKAEVQTNYPKWTFCPKCEEK